MEIILATQNAGKLKEFNDLAKGRGLKFIPIPVEHTFPEETGRTFFENAFIKANYFFSVTGIPSLGDDSGLEVEALNGRPGIHSSRYSREGTDKSNVDKLLLELKDVQDKDRSARFKCCLVLMQNNLNEPISAEGVVEGKISEGDSIFSEDSEIGKVLISENYPFTVIKYTSEKFDFNSIFKINNAKVKIIKPNWL